MFEQLEEWSLFHRFDKAHRANSRCEAMERLGILDFGGSIADEARAVPPYPLASETVPSLPHATREPTAASKPAKSESSDRRVNSSA